MPKVNIFFRRNDNYHTLHKSTKNYANWMRASCWILCLKKSAITFGEGCSATYIMSVLTPIDFRHSWTFFFCPLVETNTWKGGLARLPTSEKFSGLFFLHVLRSHIETSCIYLVGGATDQVRVAFQSGHFDLLYRQKWVKVIIFIYDRKNRESRQIRYTHLCSKCLDLYWFSSWLGNFWPSGGYKHSEGET